ncbi:MAG: Surface presentation of antigens protein SpaQ [Chlamydiia bacterium]|nr:Surface presentation of antigens protein SpaQ [Chlamydiia bacterium]MCH9616209.1 Surface presentation of antigens protein SpaQ [Chlamydiia bacterium]MCH9629805.1 Surface presentation of antigens protein SpaQ [Chlamydiia bacterium]
MSYDAQVYQLAYQALLLILILSGPPILISMTFGLMVAIFQAATQIQEQTLSFTVKLLAVVLTLIFMGGLLANQITQFTNSIILNFHKWHSS